MTRRERTLLGSSLALLAVVVTMQWLILPAMEERSLLESQLQTLTQTQEIRSGRLEILDTLETTVAQREKALQLAAADYLPVLSTEDMDEIVTALLLKHGLFPQTLFVQEGYIASPVSYRNESRQKKPTPYDHVTLQQLLQKHADPEDIRQKGSEGLLSASLTLTASGSPECWLALLDDAAQNLPYLRFTAFTLSGHEEIVSIQASLELYMAEEGQA